MEWASMALLGLVLAGAVYLLLGVRYIPTDKVGIVEKRVSFTRCRACGPSIRRRHRTAAPIRR